MKLAISPLRFVLFLAFIKDVHLNPNPITSNTNLEDYKKPIITTEATTTIPPEVLIRADKAADSLMQWLTKLVGSLSETNGANEIENEETVKRQDPLNNILIDPVQLIELLEGNNRIDRKIQIEKSVEETTKFEPENKTEESSDPELGTEESDEENSEEEEEENSEEEEEENSEEEEEEENDDAIEVSHPVARQLCRKLKEMYEHERSGRSYLWAPIYQYSPDLESEFSLAGLEFKPDCMKWIERPCNGTVRYPLMDPCSYWAPMPLKSSKCLQDADNERVVNQTLEEDETISKTLKLKIRIPQYKAMQLCHGMKDFLEKSAPIIINLIPIRIRHLSKATDKIKDCVTWKHTPCIDESDENETYEMYEPNSSIAPSGRQDETTDESLKEDGTYQDCDIWEQIENPKCVGEKPVERSDSKKAQSSRDNLPNLCDGKWPCFQLGKRKKRSPNRIKDWVQMQPHKTYGLISEENNAQDDIQLLGGSHFEPPGTFMEEDSSRMSPNAIQGLYKGPGCNCDWPCLPFFDRINRCYNKLGDLLVDSNGRPIILSRRFSKIQKQLVLCLSYLEKDEIDCFIKPS